MIISIILLILLLSFSIPVYKIYKMFDEYDNDLEKIKKDGYEEFIKRIAECITVKLK